MKPLDLSWDEYGQAIEFFRLNGTNIELDNKEFFLLCKDINIFPISKFFIALHNTEMVTINKTRNKTKYSLRANYELEGEQ